MKAAIFRNERKQSLSTGANLKLLGSKVSHKWAQSHHTDTLGRINFFSTAVFLCKAGCKLFERILFACKHYFVKKIYQCICQLQIKKILAEIFLKCFGVYFSIVISVFIFSHSILERVGQEREK